VWTGIDREAAVLIDRGVRLSPWSSPPVASGSNSVAMPAMSALTNSMAASAAPVSACLGGQSGDLGGGERVGDGPAGQDQVLLSEVAVQEAQVQAVRGDGGCRGRPAGKKAVQRLAGPSGQAALGRLLAEQVVGAVEDGEDPGVQERLTGVVGR
jgi:hypothetical protein